MEVSMYIIWNAILTLVYAPIIYAIRQNANETKRIDILINKTREEIAKDYVSKKDLNEDMERMLDRFDRLEAKIDKLISS